MTTADREPPRRPLPQGRGREDGIPPAQLAALGSWHGLTLVAGAYAGHWCDERWGLAPWGLLIGLFSAAGASYYLIYRRYMAITRTPTDRRPPSGQPPEAP